MASNSMIMFMPCEIIVHILKSENLSFVDILNFSLTCKYFHKMVMDCNNLWRGRFFQRWPSLKEPYDEYEKRFGNVSNWVVEIKTHTETKKKMISEISGLCTKFNARKELAGSELKYLDYLFCPEEGAHQMAYKFLRTQLIEIVKEHEPTMNLTLRYYSMSVLWYMTHRQLRDEWNTFISLPKGKQTMERAAVILAQWCQPKIVIEYKSIFAQLDLLANEAKELLRTNHPRHPIFSVPAKWFDIWKDNILVDNQWSNHESRGILEAICEVIFSRHCFEGNPKLHFIEGSTFINCVCV